MSDFVPYKKSLILYEELDFNESCYAVYSEYDQTRVFDNDSIKEGKIIPAPLYQQVFRWFREKYNLPCWVYTSNSKEYWYSVLKSGRMLVIDYKPFDTYEEAELACLIKLIEIVKNK